MVIGRGVTHFLANSPHVRLLSFALNAYAILSVISIKFRRKLLKIFTKKLPAVIIRAVKDVI